MAFDGTFLCHLWTFLVGNCIIIADSLALNSNLVSALVCAKYTDDGNIERKKYGFTLKSFSSIP